MLKMIHCNKFNQQKILFKKGLNSVVGDDIATNSIGKTNLLMIIDFVFGGNDYLDKNSDTVDNLGHHQFNYSFEFDNEIFYFSRDTKNPNVIFVCTENFTKVEEKDKKLYCHWLQKKYKCELKGMSFRDIVGRYFRIYGKQNLNEKKPIQYFDKEIEDISVTTLIKLFDKYEFLKNQQESLNELQSEKKAIETASKKNILNVTPNKKTYNKVEQEINKLEQEIEIMKEDVVNNATDVSTLLTKEVMMLQNKKNELIRSKVRTENQLERTEHNFNSSKSKISKELNRFHEYFPGVNIKKIEMVDSFHENLTGILKNEIKSARKKLEQKLNNIEQKISELNIQITESLKIENTPNFSLDNLISKSSDVQSLKKQNVFFDKTKKLTIDIKKTKGEYEYLRTKITDDISNEINTEMSLLNSIVYPKGKRAPNFNIHGKSYTFNTYGDTGTGTAYANFITFDLAILKLTKLPSFIHDLPLIKNIENEALENILALYNKSDKQIFIAIDKLSSYSKKSKKS